MSQRHVSIAIFAHRALASRTLTTIDYREGRILWVYYLGMEPLKCAPVDNLPRGRNLDTTRGTDLVESIIMGLVGHQ